MGIWAGPDPTNQVDAGTNELGVQFCVYGDGATITGFRVWGTGSGAVTGRVLRLWDVTTATQITDGPFPYPIDDALAAGWNEFTLGTPYDISPGRYVLSSAFGANGYGYTATPDTENQGEGGNVIYEASCFAGGGPGTYPSEVSTGFYGVDMEVEATDDFDFYVGDKIATTGGGDPTLYTLANWYTVTEDTDITHVRFWMPRQITVTNRTLYLATGSGSGGNQIDGGSLTYTQQIPDTCQPGWNLIELDTPQTWLNDGGWYGVCIDVGDGDGTGVGNYGAQNNFPAYGDDAPFQPVTGSFRVGHDSYPDEGTSGNDYFLRPGVLIGDLNASSGLFLGDQAVDAMFLGDQAVDAVHLGDVEVFST